MKTLLTFTTALSTLWGAAQTTLPNTLPTVPEVPTTFQSAKARTASLIGEGKNRLVVLGGLRLLTGHRDLVNILYIDQSPSRDRLQTTLDLSGKGTVTALTIYGERESNQFSYQLGVDGFVSSYWSIALFVGGSYHVVNNDGLKVKAGARLAYGIGSIHIGDVPANGSYFLINGQQIFDRELRLTYKDTYIALSPNISIEKRITDRVGLIANATATLGIRSKASIQFQGSGNLPLNADASKPAEVDLSDVNLSMTQSGEALKKLPLSYSGASLTIGFTYAF
jgi:hypothetical protein